MTTSTKSTLGVQASAVQKALRRNGTTLAQVAEQFGISISSVRRLRDAEPATTNGAAKHNGVAAKPATKAPTKIHIEGTKPATKAAPKAKVDKGIGVADMAVVKAAELHRLLSDVQPFAGTDDTLPMLTATRVEWDGKRLLAATTDKFTMGVSRLDVPDTGLGVSDHLVEADFMLAANDVASILRIAKTAKRDIDWRMVTISRVGEIPAGCTVPTFTFRFKFFSGETLEVKPFDVEFPKFKQLIPSGKPVARALSSFTVDYLAKFAKVANANRRIQLYSFDDSTEGGAKPTVVRIGDSFVGLIMPVRCPDDAVWVRPQWVG